MERKKRSNLIILQFSSEYIVKINFSCAYTCKVAAVLHQAPRLKKKSVQSFLQDTNALLENRVLHRRHYNYNFLGLNLESVKVFLGVQRRLKLTRILQITPSMLLSQIQSHKSFSVISLYLPSFTSIVFIYLPYLATKVNM